MPNCPIRPCEGSDKKPTCAMSSRCSVQRTFLNMAGASLLSLMTSSPSRLELKHKPMKDSSSLSDR